MLVERYPYRSDNKAFHAPNSTTTAEICDADHNSEVLLLKGEDAAGRGQLEA
jgi:hypothetical protein